MSNIQEERKGTRPLEALIPEALNVHVNYVSGGWLGRGDWLELAGAGAPALRELAQGFGKQGIDRFNEAFVTEGFEKRIGTRAKDLTDGLIGGANDPNDQQARNQCAKERDLLEDLLRRIRGGEEVLLRLGGKNIIQIGYQYGQFPAPDTITINIKKPSPSIVEA